MAATKKKASGHAMKKKCGSAGKNRGTGRKKLTLFNKFVRTETTRLKEERPDLDSKERFQMVIEHWNKRKNEV